MAKQKKKIKEKPFCYCVCARGPDNQFKAIEPMRIEHSLKAVQEICDVLNTACTIKNCFVPAEVYIRFNNKRKIKKIIKKA